MARISFQVQAIPGEKKFKDFQKNFETIMETLLYLQNAFPKIIEDLEEPEDRYGVDVIIAFDADHIEAPDGQKGFGVFDTNTDRIYIAADIPEPEDFNPHSREGSDGLKKAQQNATAISIHTPAKGVTRCQEKYYGTKGFQSTLPRRE